MGSPMRTLFKQAKTPQMYPFVIGFATVFLVSASVFRVKDEDYLNTNNKRFAAPFVKRKGLKPVEEVEEKSN